VKVKDIRDQLQDSDHTFSICFSLSVYIKFLTYLGLAGNSSVYSSEAVHPSHKFLQPYHGIKKS